MHVTDPSLALLGCYAFPYPFRCSPSIAHTDLWEDQPQPKKKEADGDKPEEDMPDPVTRKALDALRATFENGAAFLVSLMEDPILRHKIRIVTFDLQDLHQEYIEEKGCTIAVSTIAVLNSLRRIYDF